MDQKLICPEETKFHLIRHFYKYKGIIDEHVSKLLSEQKSKFFYSFASNTNRLLSIIGDKICIENIVEGKNELSIDFDDKIGFDLLVDRNSESSDFELTNRMNLVLFCDKKQIVLITAYPGKYAPPLPEKNKLSGTEYQIALNFWNKYQISSFRKFETEEKKYLQSGR